MPEKIGRGDLQGKVVPNSHNQFEALFNYATIGIVVTNHLGVIINFNNYAQQQFGYTAGEVNGQRVDILLPPSVQHAHLSHRTEFYKHPQPRRMGEGRDLYALKKDGTRFPVEVSLSHYQVDQEMFVIAFIIDITVRKKNEELVRKQNADLEKVASEVLQLNAELEQKVQDRTTMLRETLVELERSRKEVGEALIAEKELSDLKYRFVTAASHEFRTPLSTILSSAFILGTYKTDEYEGKKDKHIQRIKNAVEGMKSILEDFLSLGKLEEGKVKVRMEELDAAECVAELETVRAEMEHLLKPGQRIIFSHAIFGTTLFTDLHILKNIYINLISNAIKFSGENADIEVQLSLSGNSCTLSVKDSGIGIPEEDQMHLFDRFFRAGNASNIQGSGLGLHLIAKYLELLDGGISISSVVNVGSIFIVTFPQPELSNS